MKDIELKSTVVLFEGDQVSQMCLFEIPADKTLVVDIGPPEYDIVGEGEKSLVRVKNKVKLKLVDNGLRGVLRIES